MEREHETSVSSVTPFHYGSLCPFGDHEGLWIRQANVAGGGGKFPATVVSGPALDKDVRRFGLHRSGSQSYPERYPILLQDIKEARRAAGLSQRALSELIGVDIQVVKRMERGVGPTCTLIDAMRALDFRLTGIGHGATLPQQLRANRLARSLSLREVATRTGMSRATVAAVERGDGTIASLLRLLAVLAPKARRRAKERAYWGAGDKADRDSRFTPPDFMAHVHEAFGDIDLDPCGHRLSPVVARRRILFDEGGDGLVDEWSGRLVFVNPPFSELTKWLERAHAEWTAGRVATVVCLVPVRTDSALFHDRISADADIYLLRGRIRFLDPTGRAQPTPFSLMVLTLGAELAQREAFARSVPGFWFVRELSEDRSFSDRDA